MTKIDARGLSCPEPLILLRQAMKTEEDSYEMLVDNHAAKENSLRFAEHQGYHVLISEEAGIYTLTISRSQQ